MGESNGTSATGFEARELTDEQRRELGPIAHKLESEIVRAKAAIETTWHYMAARLVVFHDQELWRLCDCDSFEEWMASPGIELKRTQVLRLIRVYKRLVEGQHVPPVELEGVAASKVEVVLDAIDSGEVQWRDALSDVKRLTRRDLEAEYKRGRNTPLNGADEPECARCPTCGSWAPKDRLDDAA